MARQIVNMAVVFADISDSTRLYSSLGDATARVVVDACLNLINGVVGRHHGRVVKTIGDEAMCVFPTADDAVRAAVDMQLEVDGKRPGKSHVKIHVGVHYGPVLEEEDDIFGDTVNAAAYLTAVSAADQILATASAERELSLELKPIVRPVFKAVLKGSTEESTVYHVVWPKEMVDITQVNPGPRRAIPQDQGSLLLTHGDITLRIDPARPIVVAGRGSECDLVVDERFASRKHMSVRLRQTQFYVVDHSINGTYVLLESGEEVHVLRGELLLNGAGKISLGRSVQDDNSNVIAFARDRRSLFRV
jgi:class 3 adenylate cyclase